MIVNAENFYKLFLKEIDNNKCLALWNNNTKYTKYLLKDKNCVMAKIAKRFGLRYCNEYFTLDGIFFEKELKYKNLGYVQNIKVIIEHENDFRTIEKEIYKLFPLFLAPLKVVITYVESDKNIREIKKIKDIIEERIKNDELFSLHKNKIETLLIVGFKTANKVCWRGFIFRSGKFQELIN